MNQKSNQPIVLPPVVFNLHHRPPQKDSQKPGSFSAPKNTSKGNAPQSPTSYPVWLGLASPKRPMTKDEQPKKPNIFSTRMNKTFTTANAPWLKPALLARENAKKKPGFEDMFSLSVNINKKIIQSNPLQNQSFPMVVSLKANALDTTERAPIDLVCVIDTSSSMVGEKTELVKQTFFYLLKFFSGKDRLSIVTFNSKSSVLVPLTNITEVNRQSIMKQVNFLRHNYGTDINLGMEQAFRVLQQRDFKNPVTSIFLLSDGFDLEFGAQYRVHRSLSACKVGEEVTIHTFGFGSQHDAEVLTDIANYRDGNFYYIKKLDTIDEAFVDCLGGLLSVIAESATIIIKPEHPEVLPGVKIVKAYGDDSMWKQSQDSEQRYTTKITQLVSEKQKDFVLELQIPASQIQLEDDQKRIKVASVEAMITGFHKEKVTKRANLYVTLLNNDEVYELVEENVEVMKHLYRVKGASTLSQVKRLAEDRRYNAAEMLLTSFQEELLNSALYEDDIIQDLLENIRIALENLTPTLFKIHGANVLAESAKVHMQQKSDLVGRAYKNSIQIQMLEKIRSFKTCKV